MLSRRRNTELALLVMAAIVIVAAYILASLVRLAEIPANIVPFLVVILGLLLVAHIATRRLALHPSCPYNRCDEQEQR